VCEKWRVDFVVSNIFASGVPRTSRVGTQIVEQTIGVPLVQDMDHSGKTAVHRGVDLLNKQGEHAGADSTQEYIQLVEEAELPVQIDPEEAKHIVAIQQADYTQRVAQSSAYGMTATSDEKQETQVDGVFLLEFNRHHKDLFNATTHGKSLARCRAALEAEGYDWKQISGSLIFVHAHQFRGVMHALCGKTIRRGHVVISESIEYLLEESLQAVRGRGAWVKSRRSLDTSLELSACATEDSESQHFQSDTDAENAYVDSRAFELVAKRTFLCYVPRMLDPAMVAQSTTEAHSYCPNPRRFNVDISL